MNPTDYKRLRACAESPAAWIAIRLGGECGLRVNETTKMRFTDIRQSTVLDVDDAYFLEVYGKDTTGESERGKLRHTYIPISLYKAIDWYMDYEDIAPDEELIPVVKRTVQAYIKRAGEEAAEYFDYPDYAKISSHDLRARWATTLLVRYEVPEEVVMACGGWKTRENMEPYINAEADDLIVEKMRDAGWR